MIKIILTVYSFVSKRLKTYNQKSSFNLNTKANVWITVTSYAKGKNVINPFIHTEGPLFIAAYFNLKALYRILSFGIGFILAIRSELHLRPIRL